MFPRSSPITLSGKLRAVSLELEVSLRRRPKALNSLQLTFEKEKNHVNKANYISFVSKNFKNLAILLKVFILNSQEII